jgi:hypothetical protein
MHRRVVRTISTALLFATALAGTALAAGHTLTVSGTRFLLDERPFPYTGISFFNAIYNPAFNNDASDRKQWMAKFQKYGINVLRVWAQWDNKRGFVDSGPESTLYDRDGTLRGAPLAQLKAIIADADEVGVVIQVVLFSQESWHDGVKLAPAAADKAVASLTRELLPHRNVFFQVWNEFSERVLEHVKTIRAGDPKRLVTNSPGVAGFLGDPPQNQMLDFLTPHTSRQSSGRTWEIAPKEIAYLLARYKKPVVDDEPARNGTSQFGGPKEATSPHDHIIQIAKVWELGGYITYHHDMFQTGYGTPACPPHGIPDPEFSAYHHAVLKFIAQRTRYMAPGTGAEK